MNRQHISFIILFVLTGFFASCKKENYKTAKVVKDCTGTYLQLDGKDYHVCNPERVSQFEDGTVVRASFTKLIACNGSAKDAIVCMMYHANEGWIEVSKIK